MIIESNMTPEQHKQRHIELHKAFDELLADWIRHTEKMPGTSTVMELMQWSYTQTIQPTEVESSLDTKEG